MKKLFRSSTDSKIGGVCGGLAEYTETDSTLFRVLFLAAIFSPYPIILFYLLGCFIIPRNKNKVL